MGHWSVARSDSPSLLIKHPFGGKTDKSHSDADFWPDFEEGTECKIKGYL